MPNAIWDYTLEQAIAAGVVVEIFKGNWDLATGGKPVVVSKAVFDELSGMPIIDIWNEYVAWWKAQKRAGLPVDDVFKTKMNGSEVWVLEDESAVTILYPDEY